jgi:MoaA/NifB/PqqE/SkfB family radical SAM enzyme
MKMIQIFPAWGRILSGRRPFLSLEITRECPLRCPGCYAYMPEHLGASGPLRTLGDFCGQELVNRVLALVKRLRPLHISIVGGDPLVRWRELDILLPELAALGIEVQVVTSAFRPIPLNWNTSNVHLVVSIDGLRAEHDKRRSPATYERILKHIAGHRITVHCTITRQLVREADYLEEFARFWSERTEVAKIWFSLFTPQQGEIAEERLNPEDRRVVLDQLEGLRGSFPKIYLPNPVLDGYRHPPDSPDSCIFAQATNCVSCDLATRISPCQFGGQPVCSECGCVASAGLASIGNYKLLSVLPVSDLFRISKRAGERFDAWRSAGEASSV